MRRGAHPEGDCLHQRAGELTSPHVPTQLTRRATCGTFGRFGRPTTRSRTQPHHPPIDIIPRSTSRRRCLRGWTTSKSPGRSRWSPSTSPSPSSPPSCGTRSIQFGPPLPCGERDADDHRVKTSARGPRRSSSASPTSTTASRCLRKCSTSPTSSSTPTRRPPFIVPRTLPRNTPQPSHSSATGSAASPPLHPALESALPQPRLHPAHLQVFQYNPRHRRLRRPPEHWTSFVIIPSTRQRPSLSTPTSPTPPRPSSSRSSGDHLPNRPDISPSTTHSRASPTTTRSSAAASPSRPRPSPSREQSRGRPRQLRRGRR